MNILRHALSLASLQLLFGSCSSSQPPDVSTTEQAVTINYYVSPTGSGNQCKSNSPCTIATAKAKVQAAAATMTGDINVYMKTGTYVLTSPLTFGPADSGQNGFSVVWQADANATPIISGQRGITGWMLHDAAKNIWRAPASALDTRQLYVNGVRAVRARSVSERLKYTKTSTGFTAADNLELSGFAHPSDLEVSDYSSWKHHRCPVASVTAGSFQNWVYRSINNTSFEAMGSWTPDGVGDVVRKTGDFNGDGYTDLLQQYYWFGWHNGMYLSNGSTFVAVGDWLWGSGGIPFYIGDFDGNGMDDLLFPYQDGATWRNVVALSNGIDGFIFPAVPDWLSNVGQGVTYQIGDFNGDYKDDILFPWFDGVSWHNTVAISTGSSFVLAGDWAPGSGQGANYTIGDWNGDNRDDVLFSSGYGTEWHNIVALSTGSDFVFPTPAEWALGAGKGATYYVGDWDSNLRDDLLFVYEDAAGNWHNTVAMSNGSAFVFPTPSEWLPGVGKGLQYLVGDFTGDVKEDLLLSGRESVISMADPCWWNAQNRTTSWGMDEVWWIENAYELINEPGEWYLDKTAGVVYYKPRPGENMGSATVVAAVVETLINAAGALDGSGNPIFVHDIQFKNLTFSYNTWLGPSTSNGYVEAYAGWHYEGTVQQQPNEVKSPAAITLSRAQRIKFERNKFRKLGSVAINMDAGCQDNTIIGNHFTDISHSAIQVGDIRDYAETNPLKLTKGNVVKDNYINPGISEYESGVGILFGYAKNTTIAFNEIANLPYTGISIGWGYGASSYAYQNTIAQNYVHDVMQRLHDGGALYTWNAQPQTSITGNYVKGVADAVGIYLDENSHNITANGNVIDSPYLYWLQLWTESITNNIVQNNWARNDLAFCLHAAGPSANCNFGGNLVNMNTFWAGPWPTPALTIINAAGIEPAYADIKTW